MESHNDVLQRYKQSMAPSERAYHSAATLDEALRTPWALHYELERRPATPNLPSHSGEGTSTRLAVCAAARVASTTERRSIRCVFFDQKCRKPSFSRRLLFLLAEEY